MEKSSVLFLIILTSTDRRATRKARGSISLAIPEKPKHTKLKLPRISRYFEAARMVAAAMGAAAGGLHPHPSRHARSLIQRPQAGERRRGPHRRGGRRRKNSDIANCKMKIAKVKLRGGGALLNAHGVSKGIAALDGRGCRRAAGVRSPVAPLRGSCAQPRERRVRRLNHPCASNVILRPVTPRRASSPGVIGRSGPKARRSKSKMTSKWIKSRSRRKSRILALSDFGELSRAVSIRVHRWRQFSPRPSASSAVNLPRSPRRIFNMS
jgi:hypothetical protein